MDAKTRTTTAISSEGIDMKKPKYEIEQKLYIIYECSKDSIIILKANIICIKRYGFTSVPYSTIFSAASMLITCLTFFMMYLK